MSVKSVLSLFPLLLLAACGGTPPAAPASSTASTPPQQVAPAAAPASGDVLEALYGTWALDLSQCSAQALKISNTRFDGPNSWCDITGFADNGDGVYTASMSCGGAAEKVQMRPIFGPTGEGIDLVYLNRDNLATTVVACPAAKP